MALLIVAFLIVVAGAGQTEAVIYVNENATGVGSGASWADAYTDLQDALADVTLTSGDEIWVTEGRYIPHETDRAVSFELVDGVALYGGFAGTETALAQRDWRARETILTGDLSNDDHGFTSNGENSYCVVTASGVGNTTVLDGFTVTGGNNTGTGDGGGMFNSSSNTTIRNCTFRYNHANSHGGGMMNSNGSDSLVVDTRFLSNESPRGAGMNNYPSSNPTLVNVEFIGNRATLFGGGLNSWTGNNPTLVNVTFFGNSVDGGYGGGMNDQGTGKTTSVKNCIFWRNSATATGTDQISNENSPAQDVDVSYSLIQDGYPGMGNISGDPLFVREPNPGDGDWATPADNDYGDLSLTSSSPAIDAGRDAAVPSGITMDLAGNPRFDGIVDMGAYETVQTSPGTVMLDVSMAGKGSGTVTAIVNGATEEIYGERSYAEGTEVTLEAIPNQGSFFEAWDGAILGTEREITLTMDADKSCIAVFGCEAPTAIIVTSADVSAVTLDGAGSYAPGLGDSVVSYRWLQTSGGVAVALSGEDSAEATFTAPTPEPGEEFELWFKLTVTDNHGRMSTASCFVTVDLEGVTLNEAPVADAEDLTVTELTEATLIGSNSTDDEEIVSYRWRQTSGPDVTLSDSSLPDPVFRAPADVGLNGKVLWFELTVADGAGLTDVDTCIVNVTSRVDGSNQPPVADAGGTQTVLEGDLYVILDGMGSTDPDDNLEFYQWFQVAGPDVGLPEAGVAISSFDAPVGVGADGLVLWFQLLVTDEGGLQASDSCAVNVISTMATGVNGPPAAEAFVSGVQRTAAGIRVTLSGAGSRDSDGGELMYNWKLLSGSSAVLFSDPTMEETSFTAAEDTGIYTCRLTVTDCKGLVDTCECVVDIAEEMAGGTGSGDNGDGGGGCHLGGLSASWLLFLLPLSGLMSRR